MHFNTATEWGIGLPTILRLYFKIRFKMAAVFKFGIKFLSLVRVTFKVNKGLG